jgi:hypothetical protein
MTFQIGTGSGSWAWNQAWYMRTSLAWGVGRGACCLITCGNESQLPRPAGIRIFRGTLKATMAGCLAAVSIHVQPISADHP